MPKLVFVNPHIIWFKKSLNSFRDQTTEQLKYDYFINQILNSDKKFHVALLPHSDNDLFFGTLRFLNFNKFLFFLWSKLNKISSQKIIIVNNLAKLNKHDYIFMFAYGHLNFSKKGQVTNADKIIKYLNKSNAKKLIHLSHFGYEIDNLASYCKQIKNIHIVSEVDLKQTSSIFRKHFYWYKHEIIILPYCPQERFKIRKLFFERISKVVSFGTLTYPMTDRAFLDEYPDGIIQPMRNVLYQNKNLLSNEFEIFNSPISETKNIKQKSIIEKIYIRLFADFYTLFKLLFKLSNNKIKDRDYFSVDIVEEFNKYKFAIVAEEVIGLPGISAFEAMACGCILIGINNGIYESIGMVEGKHYLGYDGTIESLTDMVSKLNLKDDNYFERISVNGSKFIKQNLNKEHVFSNFLNDLKNIK